MAKPTALNRRQAHKRARTKAKPGVTSYDPALASSLLAESQSHLSTASLPLALSTATTALQLLTPPAKVTPCLEQLPALDLLGAINIELGDAEAAHDYFSRAALIDPEGVYTGAEKFLWLAQLAPHGGHDTLAWFEKGCACLRRQLHTQTNTAAAAAEVDADADADVDAAETKEKLATALCGAAEVYMTDLSFADDCEARCEDLVREAVALAPTNPGVLQTVANVRISQGRVEAARVALGASLGAWWRDGDNTENDDDDDGRAGGGGENSEGDGKREPPDFPTRISLVRLLMEVDMLAPAIAVLEQLVQEDDTSVEAWYLGGWCQRLISTAHSHQSHTHTKDAFDSRSPNEWLSASRTWLRRCLRVYAEQNYEDERLNAHAAELVAEIEEKLGPEAEGAEEEDDEWEGIDDDNDDNKNDDNDNDDDDDDEGEKDEEMAQNIMSSL